MAHYVNDKCFGCKYTTCVEVCPVDCFYEGENILVISPQECIDCGVCIPECPIDAISHDCDPGELKEAEIKLLNYNAQKSRDWPRITKTKAAHPMAESYKIITNKMHLLEF